MVLPGGAQGGQFGSLDLCFEEQEKRGWQGPIKLVSSI